MGRTPKPNSSHSFGGLNFSPNEEELLKRLLKHKGQSLEGLKKYLILQWMEREKGSLLEDVKQLINGNHKVNGNNTRKRNPKASIRS